VAVRRTHRAVRRTLKPVRLPWLLILETADRIAPFDRRACRLRAAGRDEGRGDTGENNPEARTSAIRHHTRFVSVTKGRESATPWRGPAVAVNRLIENWQSGFTKTAR